MRHTTCKKTDALTFLEYIIPTLSYILYLSSLSHMHTYRIHDHYEEHYWVDIWTLHQHNCITTVSLFRVLSHSKKGHLQ